MTKRISFLLLIIATVALSFTGKSQTAYPQKADTLVMKESDLVDFLKHLATEAKGMERTIDAERQYQYLRNGNVSGKGVDEYMQYRFDKIENMLGNVMTQLGVPYTSGRNDIILSRSSDGVSPLYLGGDNRQVSRGETDKLQQQVDLLREQMNLLISGMADKEMKERMEAISKELGGIREDLTKRNPKTMPEKGGTEARGDSVVVEKVFDNYKRQIFFQVSSSSLTTEAKHTLSDVAEVLKNNIGLNVEIIGYASPEGKAAFNTALSAKRAASVKQQLVKSGVDGKRISIKTAGADSTSDLKTYARRADIVIVK